MKRACAIVVACILLALAGCMTTPAVPEAQRPASWAVPVPGGLPNAYRVSPGLYRSAELTAEQMRSVAALGVRTVINLRQIPDPQAPPGLRDIWLPMDAAAIGDEEVIQFLRIVTTPGLTPVLVHCVHGSDRTGAMVAAYRIAVQGWPAAAAVDEMQRGSYGFHAIYLNLPHYLRRMDPEHIRAEVRRRGPWDS